MGPHPGRRPILTLKGVAKPAAPPMAPPPLPSPSKPAPRSIAIAAKTPRQLARSQAVQWLRQTYPAVFGLEVKPLALGVDRLLWPHAEAAGISRRALNDALQWRTPPLSSISTRSPRDGSHTLRPRRQCGRAWLVPSIASARSK